MERTFDRWVHFDERSRNYPIRELISAPRPRSYTWRCRTWLDQGQEGACVGFSWSHEIAARPKEYKGVTNQYAENLYHRAQQVDEWAGVNYEGTSVLAGAKVVNELGFMAEYRWAFGLDDLIMAVGHHGPAVLGINWHDGMWDIDRDGQIHVTGPVVGGHAILCNGVSVRQKLFRLHNSWGKGWGVNGEAFVSFDDMGKLLEDQGEACIPVIRN